jgi:predicted transposase/invertase (TIGR01784 family)
MSKSKKNKESKETIDHDQLFKQLLTTFFLEFLELFTPEFFAAIDPASLEILPLEYFTDIQAGERKAMDVIIRVDLRGRPNAPASSRVSVVVNCEHQSSSKTDFHRRMFFYFAQLHRKYLQPVYPIALFSFDKPFRSEQNRYQVRVPGFNVMDFNFLTIQLNQLDWRAFLTQRNPVAAALMSKMKIDPADRPRVKVECLRMIANLKLDRARTFQLSGFIDNYLQLNPVEKQQFQIEVDKIKLPKEREEVMEITTSWKEEGIVEGRESGERALTIRLLTKKVGNLSPELLAKVNGLNIERLEALAEDLLDFKHVGDLERWMAV